MTLGKALLHLHNDFYKEEKRFEIEIIDGVGFKAAKYFDIPNNNWKLDKACTIRIRSS